MNKNGKFHRSALMLAAATLALAGVAQPAAADDATPTHAQIAKAREVCAEHKQKVEQMEAKGASDQDLSKARQDWEDACAKASALMTAAGMN